MSIVRMLKTFAAAALAVVASAVSAAEVISINFTQDGYGTLDGAAVYDNLADASITGAAWNTFSGASSGGVSGTYTLTKYWDGTQAKSDGTAVVSYEAKNMWHQSGMNGRKRTDRQVLCKDCGREILLCGDARRRRVSDGRLHAETAVRVVVAKGV